VSSLGRSGAATAKRPASPFGVDLRSIALKLLAVPARPRQCASLDWDRAARRLFRLAAHCDQARKTPETGGEGTHTVGPSACSGPLTARWQRANPPQRPCPSPSSPAMPKRPLCARTPVHWARSGHADPPLVGQPQRRAVQSAAHFRQTQRTTLLQVPVTERRRR